jgi:hypothetical protein
VDAGLGGQMVAGPRKKELMKRRSQHQEGTAFLPLGSELLQSEGMFPALF